MKPCPAPRLRPCVLVAAASLAFSAASSFADEKKDRHRRSAEEVEHLRESLHDAQRELAKRNERIEDLEKELVASKSGPKPCEDCKSKASGERDRKKGAVETAAAAKPVKAKVEAKKAEARKAPEAKPAKPAKTAQAVPAKPAAKPQPPKAAPKPAAKPQPRLHTLCYAKNSAANLEGRDAALAWAREQLKGKPGLALKIVGSANDSEYPEVNRAIAGNRARFLADYFVISGMPREAIAATEGVVAKTAADAGRSAVIQVVERAAPAKR